MKMNEVVDDQFAQEIKNCLEYKVQRLDNNNQDIINKEKIIIHYPL